MTTRINIGTDDVDMVETPNDANAAADRKKMTKKKKKKSSSASSTVTSETLRLYLASV